MKKPHYNIIFATPANSFTPSYLRSLLISINTLNEEGLSWNFLSQGGSLISMARELTIGGVDTNNINMTKPCSGDFTYDMIMWIDSDISWTPSDLFSLYNSDKKIISGCYLMEDRHIPIYKQPRGGMMPEQMLDDYSTPFKVAGCGFGFISVKFGVFEKMPRPWFGPVAAPKTDLNDEESSEEFILMGEDLCWCTKAINCGFDIWVDPNVRVVHEKTFPIPFISQIKNKNMF